jgi:hypothetical protein
LLLIAIKNGSGGVKCGSDLDSARRGARLGTMGKCDVARQLGPMEHGAQLQNLMKWQGGPECVTRYISRGPVSHDSARNSIENLQLCVSISWKDENYLGRCEPSMRIVEDIGNCRVFFKNTDPRNTLANRREMVFSVGNSSQRSHTKACCVCQGYEKDLSEDNGAVSKTNRMCCVRTVTKNSFESTLFWRVCQSRDISLF